MADPINFAERAAAARTREAVVKQDGHLWTVEDMLKDVLVTGEKEVTMLKAVVVYIYEVTTLDGRQVHKVGHAQAGMTRAEEVGFLELAKSMAVEDWRGL